MKTQAYGRDFRQEAKEAHSRLLKMPLEEMYAAQAICTLAEQQISYKDGIMWGGWYSAYIAYFAGYIAGLRAERTKQKKNRPTLSVVR